MDDEWLQSLISRGWDVRQIRELLRQDYEKLHSGGIPQIIPQVVADDHRDLVDRGVDPRTKVQLRPDAEELARRRDRSPLTAISAEIATSLHVGAGTDRLLALIDVDGFVVDRTGGARALRLADDFGLKPGVDWAGILPATNAVRMAVRMQRPVMLMGHLHFRLDQSGVACVASPVFDSRRCLTGYLDLVCPADAMNVDLPWRVGAVAQSLTQYVDRWHHKKLGLLRREAAGLDVSRYPSGMVVIDWDGWVATTYRWYVGPRVTAPEGGFTLGFNDLDELGPVVLEPLWGGWLVRPVTTNAEPRFTMTVNLESVGRSHGWAGWVELIGPTVSWRHTLTPRQAEILLLVSSRQGLTEAELGRALYAEPCPSSTVRSAWLRARANLRSVLESAPYRFHDRVHVFLRLPASKEDLLPGSIAPGVIRLRR